MYQETPLQTLARLTRDASIVETDLGTLLQQIAVTDDAVKPWEVAAMELEFDKMRRMVASLSILVNGGIKNLSRLVSETSGPQGTVNYDTEAELLAKEILTSVPPLQGLSINSREGPEWYPLRTARLPQFAGALIDCCIDSTAMAGRRRSKGALLIDRIMRLRSLRIIPALVKVLQRPAEQSDSLMPVPPPAPIPLGHTIDMLASSASMYCFSPDDVDLLFDLWSSPTVDSRYDLSRIVVRWGTMEHLRRLNEIRGWYKTSEPVCDLVSRSLHPGLVALGFSSYDELPDLITVEHAAEMVISYAPHDTFQARLEEVVRGASQKIANIDEGTYSHILHTSGQIMAEAQWRVECYRKIILSC